MEHKSHTRPGINRGGVLSALLLASPAVVLALVGLAHPAQLSTSDADRWHDIHVLLLVLFPLLAVPVVWLVRLEDPPVRWAVGLLSFLYAVFYGAQDAIAGVGLGAALKRASNPDEVESVARVAAPALFAEGNALATIGLRCFLAAVVITSVVLLRRHGVWALPGCVVVCGAAISFLNSHIYWPRGGLTMLVMGLGFAACGLAVSGQPAVPAARTASVGKASGKGATSKRPTARSR